MKKLNHSIKVNLLFAVIVALLLIAVFLFNGITLALSNRYPLYADLTSNAAYEVGEETQALLGGLDAPVEIYVLSTEDAFGGSSYLQQAKRIINQYPRFSDKISLTYVDYASDPTFATQFPDLSLSNGDLIVKSGNKVKQVIVGNLFNYAYTASGELTIESSRAEEALTSAIVNVTSGESTKIAVLTGNGVTETEIFTALLADNNYDLASVNLTTDSLSGFDAALLLAPTSDLSEDVVRKLDAFLYNGGSYGKTLFYTASVNQGAMPNLDAFLSEWGVSFADGAVFETSADRTYQYQPYYPVVDYEDGKYKDGLKDASTPFLMPLSRPMQLLFSAKDGYYVETLLSFGATTGVRPSDAGEDFTVEDAALRGPLPALVLSSYNATAADGSAVNSRVAVSASTAMLDSIGLQNSSLTNSEYLLNLLADLTEREGGVNIQSKTLAGKTLGVTSAQVTTLGVVLAGVLPLCIIAAGVAVWFIRRYK